MTHDHTDMAMTDQQVDEFYTKLSDTRWAAHAEILKRLRLRLKRHGAKFTGRTRDDAKQRAMQVSTRFIRIYCPIPKELLDR